MLDETNKLQFTVDNIDKEEVENPFEIFSYKNLGKVRTMYDEVGEPWFCLQDVCYILEIKDVHVVARRIEEPYRCTKPVGVYKLV